MAGRAAEQAEGADPAAVAGAIAELLDRLDGDPAAREVGEDLVRVLMQFYGAGLEQIVSIVRLGSGDTLVHRLGADPLVAALLALHDLHPVDLPTRVGHGVDTARRRLGHHGTGITLERVDTHTGTVHVRLAAGCGSSSETLRDVVRTAVTELAPEVAAVEFTAEDAGPALMQIGFGAPDAAGPRLNQRSGARETPSGTTPGASDAPDHGEVPQPTPAAGS